MPNVHISLSVEEYNALASKIEELTKRVEFYESTFYFLLDEIEDYKKELMGAEKYDLFMELSDEANKMINRPKPKTKLIDLRTKKMIEE